MENFELIDDYLRGRLDGQDKQVFEKQLEADPTLQSEVTLQKHLIEGIKKARIAELKTMLSQVPVTGAMHSGAGISAGQIVIGAITSVVVITGALFYFKPWQNSQVSEVKIEKSVEPDKLKTETAEAPAIEPKIENKTVVAEPKKKESKKTVTTKKAGPDIQVIDPTEELTSTAVQTEKARTEKDQADVSTSRIEVETNDSNSQYSFHYQFNEKRLMLYGKFDKGLYEIIEVNGNTHSVFLFYKDSYYLLDEKQGAITPLTPIKDGQLIRKLKEYRKG